MKSSVRFIAATLIAGSALFGLSPIASADPSSKDQTSSRTSDAPQVQSHRQAPPTPRAGTSRKMPEPPANAPKWFKRIAKRVNSFFDRNRGPISAPPYEPGKTNIVCRLQRTC